MILRRLAQSILKQDWFSVAIEFVIVCNFDVACANRELRNAAWEIFDLFWDWPEASLRAADNLDICITDLNSHLAERGVADFGISRDTRKPRTR